MYLPRGDFFFSFFHHVKQKNKKRQEILICLCIHGRANANFSDHKLLTVTFNHGLHYLLIMRSTCVPYVRKYGLDGAVSCLSVTILSCYQVHNRRD